MPAIDIKSLSAAEIDALLDEIAAHRPSQEPAHPAQAPAGSFNAVSDPAWHTFVDTTTGTTHLRLRHPAFGWLNFAIPPIERAKLAGLLVTHSLTPIGEGAIKH